MSQNETGTEPRTFDVQSLAYGILEASMDGLFAAPHTPERMRLAGLMEAWGRLTDRMPPTPGVPDYAEQAADLFSEILEDAVLVAAEPEYVAVLRVLTDEEKFVAKHEYGQPS